MRNYDLLRSNLIKGEKKMSNKIEVYKAITAVAQELSTLGISKDQKNKDQGYKFRGIDDVYNTLAPIISRNNLVIMPRVLSREVTERTTARGSVLFYVVVEVEFDFISSIDGSGHTAKTFGEAMDSSDKATNKAMSAAYKYVCFQAFCIPTHGDNDADFTTHDEIKPDDKHDDSKPKNAAYWIAQMDKECATVNELVAWWTTNNTGINKLKKAELNKLIAKKDEYKKMFQEMESKKTGDDVPL